MNIAPELKYRFESVLKEEQLDDRTFLDAAGFFDELPLYSRYRQIAFLSRYGDVNELLLKLSLNYLDSIIDQKRSLAECFAAITVWDHGNTEYIVPNIFVCNGWISRRLSRLRLAPADSAFAKSLSRTLKVANGSSEFVLAQDTISSPGSTRVFIAFRRARSKRVVTLDKLRQTLPGPAGAVR
jgi:hypothetical protein